jgi:hypothetical protein
LPVEVLVMCPFCGRPQFPAAACVACHQPLPAAPPPGAAAPTSPPPSGRDKLLEAYEPYLEADLGEGKTLLLSQKRAEWKRGEREVVKVDLSSVAVVALRSRPIWEALLFVPLFAGLVVLPWLGLRLAGLTLMTAAIAACFLQRRFSLSWTLKDGRALNWVLGFGRAGTPAVQRVKSVWSSLAQELLRQGVSIREQG